MIFDKLKQLKTCYSVVVCVSRLGVVSNDSTQREYFILAHYRDAKRLDKLGFFSSSNIQTIERDLSDREVDFFKSIVNDRFDKVLSDADGRVYELKNNSFKKYYNSKNKLPILK